MKNEVIFSQLEKYADLITWYSLDLLKHESNTEAYQICRTQLMQLVNEADELTYKLFPSENESIQAHHKRKVQNSDYSN